MQRQLLCVVGLLFAGLAAGQEEPADAKVFGAILKKYESLDEKERKQLILENSDFLRGYFERHIPPAALRKEKDPADLEMLMSYATLLKHAPGEKLPVMAADVVKTSKGRGTRSIAITLLGRIGGPDHTDVLYPALEDEWTVAFKAADAIADIGGRADCKKLADWIEAAPNNPNVLPGTIKYVRKAKDRLEKRCQELEAKAPKG